MKLILQILLICCLLTLISILVYKGIMLQQSTIPVCPVNAISMVNGKAEINTAKCIGCRRCVDGIAATKKGNSDIVTTRIDDAQNTISANSTINPLPAENTELKSTLSQPTKPKSHQPTVSQPKQSHIVNADKCIGCTLCVSKCPVNAIKMVDNKAIIDKDKCINCGICANGDNADFAGCPVGAISSP
ncbi:MAG: 4Fe-4S binding protein [Candidatus Cloacimonetes bacterium]|nr:4Fe-4S binding protein [Candidatus Cloacimonadota bacterium]